MYKDIESGAEIQIVNTWSFKFCILRRLQSWSIGYRTRITLLYRLYVLYSLILKMHNIGPIDRYLSRMPVRSGDLILRQSSLGGFLVNGRKVVACFLHDPHNFVERDPVMTVGHPGIYGSVEGT